ncbi:MAG: MinD/ParA family protein [Planctomycetes bacterium]|nr:MinD/ParA family protein [Planctomycetota bacterium]
MADQAATLRNLVGQSNRYAKVITFASGKGGVGKSNIISNTAITLAGMGVRVAILDMDLGLANLDILLGVSARFNLTHVMSGQKKITDIIIPGPNDIMFIPGASGVSRLANLNEEERTFLIRSFADLESMADIILVDTGAGLSDNVLQFALSSQALVVVTTPEPTARMDAYALIKTVHGKDGNIPIHVVVNEVTSEAEARRVYSSLNEVSRKHLSFKPELLGFLPCDPKIPAAVKMRRPFVLESPRSPASKAVGVLSADIKKLFLPNSGAGKDRVPKSFFSRLFSLLNRPA